MVTASDEDRATNQQRSNEASAKVVRIFFADGAQANGAKQCPVVDGDWRG